MAASGLPPLPAQFKTIQHFLRTAQELDKREPVVAYYCRLYAMQTGMKIDSKNPECRKFLCKLMDQLEAMKKQLGDNEAITQEIVGCAHVENYALKMFLYADNEDRAGQFHKNMIKSFYTASLLIDVLTVFGELTDEVNDENEQASSPIPSSQESEPLSTFQSSNIPTNSYSGIHIPPGAHAPANTPAEVPHSTGETSTTIQPTPQNVPLVDPSLYNVQPAGEIRLTPEDFARAQKYCKFAGSALQYEDVSTAVQNLQKALKLLTTGRE
ncbi:Vacuolar protein sorting-associated protein VTA1-like protein [Ophiophagus hannah]|uniref:Vacuolar protein sorting-associated protein VTA1-like protein n=1 Tax=Ophiophagus hannah TaxID=8665 RepID=V8P9J8_OPHHA|nr:Vacuolar protein sorting-associated protein VTA1-like protein [Ophiophagus hannah]